MNEETARLRAIVRGRVQGVGFRYFVERNARELGLTGWVRNLPDGSSVEVEAEGERAKLEELLARLHQGPRMAAVDKVESRWDRARGEYQGFGLRY